MKNASMLCININSRKEEMSGWNKVDNSYNIQRINRAPPSKMRETYSYHFVRPSVCLSVRLSVCPHFVVMR